MEKSCSGDYTFLISKRRLIKETDKSYVFVTSRSRLSETIVIPKNEKTLVSIEEGSIEINDEARRKAFKIVIKSWFAEVSNIRSKGELMSSSDFREL